MKSGTSIRYNTYIFICLFTLLSATALGQQSTVTGKIHLVSGESVSHATIRVKGTDISSMSDKDGQYSLNNVPYGNREIQVTAIEIEPKTVRLKVDKPIHDFSITVTATGDIAIEGVEVEGKTVKRDIETSGFAVNVVETKEASLRNLQTNELLDRTVGVRVRQNGGMGSNVEYNLNGMTGRSIGVFIDGIEISTYGSSFNLNNIPPAMIERIEVYKGVLPSHLSGDYMGGAINVVLKKDASQNNATASVSYGSFNTFQTDASGMYRNNKNGFTAKVSGFYTYTDNSYETWGKFSKYITPDGRVQRNYRARRFNDSYKSLGGRFELGFTNVKWADVFLIGYNGSDTHNEIPHGQTMGRPYVGRFNEAQAHVFSLNYNKKDLFTKGLNFNLNGIYSDRNTYLQDTVGWIYNWDGNYRLDVNGNPMYRRGEGQQGAKVITDIDRRITTLRSNLSYDIFAGHRLSVNHVYYTVDRNDIDRLNPITDNSYKAKSDLAKNVTAINYEAQMFHDRLRTNLFAKHYHQNTGKTTPSVTTVDGGNAVEMLTVDDTRSALGYGFAVSYAILPKFIFIGSTERAVRMPGETEIFGDPSDNVIANPNIRPEISNNYNFGFRSGSFNFQKHKFSLSVNAFSRNVKDRIMRQANTNLVDQEVEISPFVNIGLAKSLGFEGELGYIYDNKLNVMFTFSKFNSLLKGTGAEAERLTPYYNQQIPNEPFFTMNGNAQYRLDNILQKKSILNVFYNFGYVAPFRTIWPESEWFTTPTQFSHDVGLNYRFPDRKIVVSLDAKNIFNAEIYDNFGVQKPGRAFYLKLNYTINTF
ncbi:MAG TPA: TonB-dependent receptor plug domain-containing protein [Sphingobacterium sp.]|jgi:outer membrane receptor protein involved in Fe transport|nr:TonB-dependent receptor plug domain-containing protein [Sphingobacterium sp.]